MLNVVIPSQEFFNDKEQTFMNSKQYELRLEHSLISLSKWESKWKKPFLTKSDKTNEETLDYIRCMTITQNVDPAAYNLIPKSVMDQIADYIYDPMTATTFGDDKEEKSKQIVTSELVYYWMVAFSIPFECQTWHLNRLLTLIKICSIKNQPPKKMKPGEVRSRQRALNQARKAKLNTSG